MFGQRKANPSYWLHVVTAQIVTEYEYLQAFVNCAIKIIIFTRRLRKFCFFEPEWIFNWELEKYRKANIERVRSDIPSNRTQKCTHQICKDTHARVHVHTHTHTHTHGFWLTKRLIRPDQVPALFIINISCIIWRLEQNLPRREYTLITYVCGVRWGSVSVYACNIQITIYLRGK